MLNDSPHRGVQCPKCKKRMFSYSVHDYRTCGCPNDTMIDGGKSYLRYGGMIMPKVIEYDEKLDGLKIKNKKKGKK